MNYNSLLSINTCIPFVHQISTAVSVPFKGTEPIQSPALRIITTLPSPRPSMPDEKPALAG